jgi:hypothetical protein
MCYNEQNFIIIITLELQSGDRGANFKSKSFEEYGL